MEASKANKIELVNLIRIIVSSEFFLSYISHNPVHIIGFPTSSS